jgi:hypothetical protein
MRSLKGLCQLDQLNQLTVATNDLEHIEHIWATCMISLVAPTQTHVRDCQDVFFGAG